MSANISVITSNTRDAIVSVVNAFNGNVLAHINGDYGLHNQVRLYNTPFIEPTTLKTVSDHTLRIQLFNPNTSQTVVLAIPCFITGSDLLGGPPVILIEPTAKIAATIGDTDKFSVSAASQSPLSYQWQKLFTPGFANLSNQTSASLVLPNVQTTDAGAYQVVVTNSFGTAISSTGSLTVALGGGKVANPTITPPGSTLNHLTVTLSDATAGATIFFTVSNLGAPPGAYVPYSVPFTLGSGGPRLSNTVYAFATKSGMANSDVVRADFPGS